jgi:hypothetical protein
MERKMMDIARVLSIIMQTIQIKNKECHLRVLLAALTIVAAEEGDGDGQQDKEG